MKFRQAIEADITNILTIISQAKERMRLAGSLQWQDGYPAMADIERDIKLGYGYIFELCDEIIAYAAIVFDGEAAYDSLDGKWLTNQPYVVVHRLAVSDKMKHQGIATRFMQQVELLSLSRGVTSFKVDTNFDNHYMQHMLSALGFTYCGEIMYEGAPRMAFEKCLN